MKEDITMNTIVNLGGKEYTRISTVSDDLVLEERKIKKVCWAVCKSDSIPGTEFFDKESDPKNYDTFKNHNFFRMVKIIFENGTPHNIYDKYDNFIMDADLITKESELTEYEEKEREKE